MSTTGDRLVHLAGGQPGSAAALLRIIGTGPTTGEALAQYSGLPAGAAMLHLMADRIVVPKPPDQMVSGGWHSYPRRRDPAPSVPRVRTRRQREHEDILLF